MNKIIPFKQKILFDTGINEVVSISLEHNYKIEDNKIEGNFLITGEYKINDSTVNIDPFNKEIPFTIDIDENYNLDNVEVEIDDFYYEILNNNYLSVNIDILIKNLEETRCIEEECFDELTEKKEEIKEEEPQELEELPEKKDDKIVIDEDNYTTYKIYIVKEEDTIENIILRYETDKETLEKYNDISEVNIGDKIIIPLTHARN